MPRSSRSVTAPLSIRRFYLHLRGFSINRSISLFISLFGTIVHFALAIKFSSLWPSLKSEPESEWEGSLHSWSGDSLSLLWGLLSCYFALDSATSFVGFIGIAKNIPSCVRFCRDYSIADLFFITFSAAFGAYAASTNPSFRAGLCEELSRQPDLMRDMVDIGFNLENCEAWFEKVFLVIMALTAVVIIIRVHFVIAISSYYSHLSRTRSGCSSSYTPLRTVNGDSLHRIYLLPTPSSPTSSNNPQDVFVYTPVLLSSLSEQQAREMKATEAWISHSETPRTHRPSHRHNHSGRISLPIRPDESLSGNEKA